MRSELNLRPTQQLQTNHWDYSQSSRRDGSNRTSRVEGCREDLLAALRGSVKDRPVIDPNLSGGLRAWLEDEVIELANSHADSSSALIINTARIVEACARESISRTHDKISSVQPQFSLPVARGAIIHALFYQWVNAGRFGNPFDDAMDALELSQGQFPHQELDSRDSMSKRHQSLLEFIRQLPEDDLDCLKEEVAYVASMIRSQFPVLSPRWLPRTREQISLPLAGGRVILTATIDLIIGLPAANIASTCVVNLRSGEFHPQHILERRIAALLETVRSGAQPFRVATYYPSLGRIDTDDVTEDLLTEAVQMIAPSLHGVRS